MLNRDAGMPEFSDFSSTFSLFSDFSSTSGSPHSRFPGSSTVSRFSNGAENDEDSPSDDDEEEVSRWRFFDLDSQKLKRCEIFGSEIVWWISFAAFPARSGHVEGADGPSDSKQSKLLGLAVNKLVLNTKSASFDPKLPLVTHWFRSGCCDCDLVSDLTDLTLENLGKLEFCFLNWKIRGFSRIEFSGLGNFCSNSPDFPENFKEIQNYTQLIIIVDFSGDWHDTLAGVFSNFGCEF